MFEQRQIVDDALAETEAGIDGESRGSMPAVAARGNTLSEKRADLADHVVIAGAACMVRGSPFMCMRQMPAPSASRPSAARPVPRSARTSLMMSAPAAQAARMTSGLLVSTEMNTRRLAPQCLDDRNDALEFFVETRRERRRAAWTHHRRR